MISHKVKSGSVGVNHNHDKTSILLQVTDDDNQARVQLSVEDAKKIMGLLLKEIKSLSK